MHGHMNARRERGSGGERLAAGVLDEVGETVFGHGLRAAVPTAADVAPDTALAVVGGACGAVPQVGMVQQHVAAFAVHADLARDLLEAGWHPVRATEVRPGYYAQEPVLG